METASAGPVIGKQDTDNPKQDTDNPKQDTDNPKQDTDNPKQDIDSPMQTPTGEQYQTNSTQFSKDIYAAVGNTKSR